MGKYVKPGTGLPDKRTSARQAHWAKRQAEAQKLKELTIQQLEGELAPLTSDSQVDYSDYWSNRWAQGVTGIDPSTGYWSSSSGTLTINTDTGNPPVSNWKSWSVPSPSDPVTAKPGEEVDLSFSLEGWLWGRKYTIDRIEIDESAIAAVIQTVFGLEEGEEIITVLVKRADGSTDIRGIP